MDGSNMVNLQISESFTDTVSADNLEQAALETLARAASSAEVELTIVLENDDYIRKLNNQFRYIDAPTDVLSFPSDDVEDPDSGLTYLGDIVISVPTAQNQAHHAGHPLQAELQLLTIHGVLHLLGYDHADEDQKSTMWRIQADILTAIGAEINSLPDG